LKEQAVDRAMWRARCGRGFGPVVRQTAKWVCVFAVTGTDAKVQYAGMARISQLCLLVCVVFAQLGMQTMWCRIVLR